MLKIKGSRSSLSSTAISPERRKKNRHSAKYRDDLQVPSETRKGKESILCQFRIHFHGVPLHITISHGNPALLIATAKPIKHPRGFTSNFTNPLPSDALFPPSRPPCKRHVHTCTRKPSLAAHTYTYSVFLQRGMEGVGSGVVIASADATDAICVQSERS